LNFETVRPMYANGFRERGNVDCPSEPIELNETMLRIAIAIGSTQPGRNGEAVAAKLNADVGVAEKQRGAVLSSWQLPWCFPLAS
jgi:hypothetical protein